MQNRREFLETSGLSVLGSLVLPSLSEAFSKPKPIGIQLFTINRLMNTEDIKVILEKIAAVGYKEIESAFSSKPNFYGYNPTEFKKIVEDLGMKWIAHHVGGASYRGRPPGATPPPNATPAAAAMPPRPQMLNLRDNYQQVVDNAIEGGLKYVVCASTPIGTMDDIKASIETFNKTGEACKKSWN